MVTIKRARLGRVLFWILALFCSGLIASRTALADISIELASGIYRVKIFGTISQNDANKIRQRESDLEFGILNPEFYLNSPGGDVDAALSIGRIIRRIDGFTRVEHDAQCFSSCALLYIAGVNRIVDWDTAGSGKIGLHRPYFASSPQRRATIEREAPKLLKSLKNYIEEMGITEDFYREMVNTEPSNMVLYGSKYKGLRDVYRIVPNLDPTYDEVEVSYDARWHGLGTGEMRRRAANTEPCAGLVFNKGLMDDITCTQTKAWGFSDPAIFQKRWNHASNQCRLSDDERKELNSVKRKDRRDHPIYLKREVCVRRLMQGD